VRSSLDENLRKAAEQARRSISEEIEFRLERSFVHDRFTDVVFQTLLDQLGRLAEQVGKLGGTVEHTSQFLAVIDIAAEMAGRTPSKQDEPKTE
jgi:hypothetical protein